MPNDEWYDEHDIRLICSIEQMLDLVKGLEKECGKSSIYFRGQEWKDKDKEGKNLQLLPAIGREEQKFCGKWPAFDLTSEVNLLHRFRRWAYLELKRPVGEWEALFLGRHHLLPVRLLDWTSNPLFALYFACECEKEPQGDAAVWVIVKDNSIEDIDVLKEEWGASNETNKEDYYQCWHELPPDMKERYKEYKKKGVQQPPKAHPVKRFKDVVSVLCYSKNECPTIVLHHSGQSMDAFRGIWEVAEIREQTHSNSKVNKV